MAFKKQLVTSCKQAIWGEILGGNAPNYAYSFEPYYEIGAANDLKYMQTNAEYYDAIIYCNDVESSVNYTESE